MVLCNTEKDYVNLCSHNGLVLVLLGKQWSLFILVEQSNTHGGGGERELSLYKGGDMWKFSSMTAANEKFFFKTWTTDRQNCNSHFYTDEWLGG